MSKTSETPNADFTTTFARFGTVLTKRGTQAVGDCPICAKPQHFFVNPTTGQYHCKVCGRKGNIYGFLSEIYNHAEMSARVAKELSEARKLPADVFRRPLVRKWGSMFVIPVWNGEGKLVNLHTKEEGKAVMSAPNCSLHLFGENLLAENPDAPVYVCEGPWDMIAMQHLLSQRKEPGIAVGVPGANTFKNGWEKLFAGRAVTLLYDDDEPGRTGQREAAEKLTRHAASIRCVDWSKRPDDFSGKDVNDLVAALKGRAWKALDKMLVSANTAPATPEPTEPVRNVKTISLAQCRKVFAKWLHRPDPDQIDVVLASIATNSLPDDPLWLFFVGPPGSGKTEDIQAVSQHPEVYPLSSLTPAALITTLKSDDGKGNSLAPRLDGKVLAMKDFTVVLSMQNDARHELFGILRDLYDGSGARACATGEVRVKSKFNFIAGVTGAIEEHTDVQSQLGARFLHYRVSDGDERERIKRSLANAKDKGKMREELSDAALGCLQGIKRTRPKVSAAFQDRIIRLADLLARARSYVARDRDSKQLLRAPEVEVGTRIVCQLIKLGLGVAMVRGKRELSWEEYGILRKVVLDTMPSLRRMVLFYLLDRPSLPKDEKDYGEWRSTDQITKGLKISKSTVDRNLQDLHSLGVIDNDKREATTKKVQVWKLTKDTASILATGPKQARKPRRRAKE